VDKVRHAAILVQLDRLGLPRVCEIRPHPPFGFLEIVVIEPGNDQNLIRIYVSDDESESKLDVIQRPNVGGGKKVGKSTMPIADATPDQIADWIAAAYLESDLA
jgi:hypothetical protein